MFFYKRMISEMTDDEIEKINKIKMYQKNVRDQFSLFKQSLSQNSLSNENKDFIIKNCDYLDNSQISFVENIFPLKTDKSKQKFLYNLKNIDNLYFLNSSVFLAILCGILFLFFMIGMFILGFYGFFYFFDPSLIKTIPMLVIFFLILSFSIFIPKIVSNNCNSYNRKDIQNIKKELSSFSFEEDDYNNLKNNLNIGNLIFDNFTIVNDLKN